MCSVAAYHTLRGGTRRCLSMRRRKALKTNMDALPPYDLCRAAWPANTRQEAVKEASARPSCRTKPFIRLVTCLCRTASRFRREMKVEHFLAVCQGRSVS